MTIANLKRPLLLPLAVVLGVLPALVLLALAPGAAVGGGARTGSAGTLRVSSRTFVTYGSQSSRGGARALSQGVLRVSGSLLQGNADTVTVGGGNGGGTFAMTGVALGQNSTFLSNTG